jgi:hypothetical protein
MDGGCRKADRSAHDAPPQPASSAPCHTRSSVCAPRCPSVCSANAARSAACRSVKLSGHARLCAISVPALASCAQRRSVLQLAPSAATRAVAVGAMASRTAGALSSWIPNSASANPMAQPAYSRRRTTPRGATVTVAPHLLHLYRRTLTVRSPGGCPTASGPRCSRWRTPWPCSCTQPPSGRLGAPHCGQQAGRAASHCARSALHLLPAASSSIVCWLRSFTMISEHDERWALQPPLVTYCGHLCACSILLPGDLPQRAARRLRLR